MLSGPPSTLRDLVIETSRGDRISNPIFNAPVVGSSPVTDGTGASNTSSWPVVELTFLFPT